MSKKPEDWVVYDVKDLTILGIFSIEEDAYDDANDINNGKGTKAKAACHLEYEYIVRRRELRAQMAATIYAGVIADGSDGQSTIDWAIERADELLERLNQ